MTLLPPHNNPFQHTAKELQVLLDWSKSEILPLLEGTLVPPPILAMKLMSCSRNGPKMPLAWPIGGMSALTSLQDAAPQLQMAMEDIIRLGHLYFPDLFFSISECERFRDCIDPRQALPDEAWKMLEKGKL
jgi:hypothetical protein